MNTVRWHILTGEYPPQAGGVADYTQVVARGLACAGDAVDVWSPRAEAGTDAHGVTVHALADHFGARALGALTRHLHSEHEPRRLLVQYVPHAFGWKGSNVPFCLWLRAHAHEPIWVMFHEVAFPVARHQRLSQNGLGLVTRGMAALVASAASRAFVSIPAWEPMVRRTVAASTPIEWMPVPSAIPVDRDPDAVAAIRARYANGRSLVGHFGTCGRLILPLLADAVRQVAHVADANLLFIGRGSVEAVDELVTRLPDLRGRLQAAGAGDARQVSHHVAACDVMLQPYPDGVSSRRTSVMVALAHARPVVTTSGALTEHIWHEGAGVVLCPVGDAAALAQACASVIREPADAARLGAEARAVYDSRFDVRHTITMLRAADPSAREWRAVS